MAALFVFLVGLTYFWLKDWGFIGRQFSDGVNTQATVNLSAVGDEAIVEVEASRRGITRYSLRRSDADMPELSYTLLSYETLCGEKKPLGTVSIMSSLDKTVYFDDPRNFRGGKHIRPPIHKRQTPVCIHIKLKNYSQRQPPPPSFSLYVGNTRPCWGIECLLD